MYLFYYELVTKCLQTSPGHFADHSSLDPLFYKELQNGVILLLFFLEFLYKELSLTVGYLW